MADESNTTKILLVAGEASGDLHGAHLVEKLRDLDPSIQYYGVGGDRMQAAGVELLDHISDMAVVGVTEVLSKARSILAAYHRLKRSLTHSRPDLVVLIDYPEFNLFFARAVNKKSIPIVYFISPQIWAWRQGRVRKIAKLIEKMIVIFPFEKDFYEKAGIDVDFVGNPLLDAVRTRLSRDEALREFGLKPGVPTIGLLPGSRMGEIRRHLPTFLDAVPLIRKRVETVQFILLIASGIDRDHVAALCNGADNAIKVVASNTYDAMHISDFLLVASGTATVEAAIVGTPMAIIYRVSPLTYYLGRLLIKTQNVGMVNIIAQKTIVPELLQHDFTPEAVANISVKYLQDTTAREEMKRELRVVRERLGKPGAPERASQSVYNVLRNIRQRDPLESR